MNPLTVAILRSGLVSEKVRLQLERWGHTLPPVQPLELPENEDGAILLGQILEEALINEDLVTVRTQDLDVIERYLATARQGLLRIVVDGVESEFPVMFGRSVEGDFLFPWRGETLSEEMTKSTTQLTWTDNDGAQKVEHFTLCSELYAGLVKIFMSCTPA